MEAKMKHMPHKKNPDVFELIRAKCSRIQAAPNELTLLLHNLPSGYHRDLQLTKEILFPFIEDLLDCLGMARLMLSRMEVRDDILSEEKYRYIFSVEAVNELVNQGIPFREAYRQVGNQIEKGQFHFDQDKGLHHTHEVFHGHAFPQELGVGNHIKLSLVIARNGCMNLFGCTHRHGAFVNNDLVIGDQFPDMLGHTQYILKVG